MNTRGMCVCIQVGGQRTDTLEMSKHTEERGFIQPYTNRLHLESGKKRKRKTFNTIIYSLESVQTSANNRSLSDFLIHTEGWRAHYLKSFGGQVNVSLSRILFKAT